jgi:hypothetical protein
MPNVEKPLAKITNEAPAASLGTSFTVQKYLFAFATQFETREYLRTQPIPDEANRAAEILKAWQEVQPRVQALVGSEAGLADTIVVEDLPTHLRDRVRQMLKAFQPPISVAMVEIDKLVAPQRKVDLEYVKKLHSELPAEPTLDDLLELCLSGERPLAPVQHLEVGPNAHIFSSPSTDIRFLGAFLKDTLSADDLAHAPPGGMPVAAIVGFIGYGASPVNAYAAGRRMVLSNGFHRLYALRALGINLAPVLVQNAANPQLDFPPHLLGIPREYLLTHQRPVLMKDFFETGFTADVRIRNRIRVVSVQVTPGQHDVPA